MQGPGAGERAGSADQINQESQLQGKDLWDEITQLQGPRRAPAGGQRWVAVQQQRRRGLDGTGGASTGRTGRRRGWAHPRGQARPTGSSGRAHEGARGGCARAASAAGQVTLQRLGRRPRPVQAAPVDPPPQRRHAAQLQLRPRQALLQAGARRVGSRQDAGLRGGRGARSTGQHSGRHAPAATLQAGRQAGMRARQRRRAQLHSRAAHLQALLAAGHGAGGRGGAQNVHYIGQRDTHHPRRRVAHQRAPGLRGRGRAV